MTWKCWTEGGEKFFMIYFDKNAIIHRGQFFKILKFVSAKNWRGVILIALVGLSPSLLD